MMHAVLLAVVADGLLSLMDALVKSVTSRYPTFEIAFLRFASGSIWASLLLAVTQPGWPARETIIYNGTRSILVVITGVTFFYALSQLPLADTVALSFLSPMFIALFGGLILRERVDGRIALALAIGLAGMLLIAGGKIGGGTYESGAILGVAACLISAVSYAMALVLLRARAQRDPLPMIVFFQNLGPMFLLTPAAMLVWVTPTAGDLGLFVILGLLGVAGHYLLALAFARAEAARLAPIQYTSLVWAVVFGYLFFGEVPGLSTWLGAGLIVLGTIFTQRGALRPKAAQKD